MLVPLGSGHSHVPRYLHTPSSSHVDASHMGPKFRSGTKGYDHDPLPIRSPATTRNPKLVGGESFTKGRGKSLYKMVLEVMFWKT
jgi:hypothetical protein